VPEQVAAYDADKIMIGTITYDHERRRPSYVRLAEAFTGRVTA
jgi:hypothetical protein